MRHKCPLCGEIKIARGSRSAHDICEACSRALLKLSAYLESMDSAVAIVSHDLTVISSNDQFRKFLDDHGRGPVGMKIGEVLDCKYGTLRHRCGKTAACQQCDFKRIIELSRLTGEKLTVISTIFRHPSGARTTFKVSTEKAGEAVLVRLRLMTRGA